MKGFAIRWLIRVDLDFVVAIEQDSFDCPWTRDEFINALRQRGTIGMVCEVGDDIAGYMLYELHKNRLRVINFAIAPKYRRNGYGKAMVDKLVAKINYQGRSRITIEVRETNLIAQLFWQSQGFRAVTILRDWYEDTTESAIVMQYHVNQEANKCFI